MTTSTAMCRLLLALLLVACAPRLGTSAPIALGSVAFNSTTGLYTYEYVVSGVDPGRKVTGIAWLVGESGGPSAQPDFLPLVWTVPLFWNFLPASSGVWQATTGDDAGGPDFPISPTWGTLLAGDSRTFSFTTGYAPREGTYILTENAYGSEVNYNHLMGTTIVPHYTGNLIETPWRGQNTLHVPPGFPEVGPARVPEPSVLALIAVGLMGAMLRQRGLR